MAQDVVQAPSAEEPPAGPQVGSGDERFPLSFTELRIHGVSGTPPESMLRHAQVHRVAGDARSGFYRRTLAVPDGPDVLDQRLEAYSWSGLTSGRASRAFWLLLLPFALVNVASWAAPGAVTSHPRARSLLHAGLRLLALSLTGTLVVAAAGIGMDVLAWQCSTPGSPCAEGGVGGVVAGLGAPGRRLAAGALVPAAVIALLWILGRSTWHSYEQEPMVHPSGARSPVAARAADVPLADPRFWEGEVPVGRLRTLHVTAAWTLLAVVVAVPALQTIGDGAPAQGLRWVVTVSTVLLIGCAVAVLVPWLTDRRTGRQDEPRAWRMGGAALSTGSLALAVTAAVLAALPASGEQRAGRMPLVSELLELGFAVQALLVVALFAVTAYLVRASGPDSGSLVRVAARGYALPVISALAWLLAGGLSAGAVLSVASWLGRGGPPLELAPLYAWVSVVALVLLVVVLPVVLVHAVLALRRLRRLERAEVERDNPPAAAARGYLQRVRAVTRARAVARMTDLAGTYLSALVLSSLAVVLAGAVAYASGQQSWPGTVLPRASELGALGMAAVAAGFFTIGFRAYRDPRLRKTVGIVWDVTSFWPRAAHPLAPPCYAEKIIPDLNRRVQGLAGDPGRGLLLSAHSQGTVIALATVLQLEDTEDESSRVCLLTYGAPLTRLYAAFFPGYVNRATYDEAMRRLGCPDPDPTSWPWRNLYRPTDPIGGWVLDGAAPDGPDLVLVDPVFDRPPADPSWPAVLGHSDYWADDAFEQAKARVVALRTASRRSGAHADEG